MLLSLSMTVVIWPVHLCYSIHICKGQTFHKSVAPIYYWVGVLRAGGMEMCSALISISRVNVKIHADILHWGKMCCLNIYFIFLEIGNKNELRPSHKQNLVPFRHEELAPGHALCPQAMLLENGYNESSLALHAPAGLSGKVQSCRGQTEVMWLFCFDFGSVRSQN